ncbi:MULTISPECIES: ATP-binding protein [unclassified Acinetobacter]|uniref:ATP-binding protein n=1 Tax=unclassified Acinetobacter TaxID=196816 RepID=UPI00293471B1|nr:MULTISPECIES: ATP-binding protein [unclassified Acinetobacter]WOE33305.1 ATP-binding protein [Acinetobacter sp. SAAs470]WOE37036.1 ATP-binding protein [Acinetobacter sp. SAAs474]
MEKYKIFFGTKFSIISLILVLLHQSVIALSVIFLTNVINDFQNHVSFSKNLLLYLFCMIFPYFPGLISFVFLQKWVNYSHQEYLNYVYKNNSLSPFDLKRKVQSERIGSLISRNSFSIVTSTLFFLHDFLTLFLNSFLSLIIFFIILPKEIFIGYFLSFIISFILIIMTRKIIEKINYDVEFNMIEYGNFLNKFPDNYAIQNSINKNTWFKKSKKYGESYYNSTLKAQLTRQSISLVLAMIAILPTSYLIFITLTSNEIKSAVMAAIIVNITRIYAVLSSLNSVLSSFIEIPSIIGRLKILFDLNETNIIDKNSLIKNIKINDELLKNNDDRFNYLISQTLGRFTIRGGNGSGKSTFLHELKDKIGDDAILVPTNLNNLLWSEDLDLEKLSTGQKINKIINLVKNNNIKYLLLDEWDANLDKNKKIEINNLLDSLSLNKVIVEVRH